MDKKEYAIELRSKKYNCCQAVACSFAAEAGIPEEVLFKVAEGFGMGLGCMEGVCGALSACIILNGFKNSTANLTGPDSAAATVKNSKVLTQAFKEKCGAVICKDLKGVETGTMLCSCPDCIRAGVAVCEELLFPAKNE